METLNTQDLREVKGGASKLLWYAVAALITLGLGIIDGIVNPEKCNIG